MKKDKKADYTDIKNRRERGSHFKMMFFVIGFEIQRQVLSQCLLLQTEPKAGCTTCLFVIDMEIAFPSTSTFRIAKKPVPIHTV
ncbi:MAG: hypothetical protein Q4F21_13360 [Lachnospiraceae bacterium]|nr:hypothetical protein [Lachnospiraceae bacterium]